MNDTNINKKIETTEKSSILRKIFLNLFISVFMICSYVYISLNFGSISTFYVLNTDIFVEFGVTLLIFTFFSILAGPIHGFIAGFMGELLYQLATYSTFHLYWCLIIAIFGFISSIYKYKPLKYHEGKKVYYTFLIIIITTFITMFLIIWFEILFGQGNSDLETIILNFGVKFLLQSLVSVVFFVPLLLILYDKVLASEEKEIYSEMLTHHPLSASDHTITLTFGRTKIYFCTRCSGTIIGAILAGFFTEIFRRIMINNYVDSFVYSPELAILICIIVPIPGLMDWGTQRLLYRSSTTESRLLTGFVIGIALHFIVFTRKYYFLMLFILILYFSIFGLLMFFGSRKELRLYKKNYNEFTEVDGFNNPQSLKRNDIDE